MGTTLERGWRRSVTWMERIAVLGAIAGVVGACSDDDPAGPGATPAVAYVEVSPEDLLLVPGDTATLAALLFASDGTEIAGRPVTWSSSAPQFATVEANGRVTAKAPGGPVLITATSEGKTGPAFVVVAAANPAPVVTVLDPATVSAGSGPTSVTILGQGFAPEAEARWNGAVRPTTWLAAGVLEVELTAADLGQVGQGELRVFNPSPGGGLSGPIHLQITPAVVAVVELAPFSAEIDAGAVLTLSARGLDASGGPVEAGPAQWSTRDPQIASVTPSGVLMGHQAGKTMVRAEIAGRFADAEITVRVGAEPVAYVFVEPYEVVALVGNTRTLSTLVISTSGATIVGRPVTWTSLDPSVVEVDDQGRMTARRKGTTQIRAEVGGREGTARVEVREYPIGPLHTYDLKLDPLVLFNEVGDTTWMVDGVTRAATLHLAGAEFEVDRSTDTYRLSWTLRVAVAGSWSVGTTTRTETGTAVRYSRGPDDYGYSLTPTGGAPMEVPAGIGSLTMRRSLGRIQPYPFHFVIR